MGELGGKGAVITGGSRGIGRAIVRRLARDGAAVVFNYVRGGDEARRVEREVREAGGTAHAVQVDLAAPDAVDELMRAAERHLDALDILVNNAAVEFQPVPISDTDDELFDRVMTVNARAAFHTIRHATRQMRDGGRIVNISTLNTTRPAPGIAAYAASKGAVEQLTKVAALELGSRGITVNTVCPGATDTDLFHRVNPAGAAERVAAITPLGRLGTPADVADVVAMLVGRDGRWLTGQTINATGGLA